jgi:LmbE family N-acetylglucosaminyl deacetylase
MFVREMENLRVLTISPHTDDAIITTGGTISRILEEGGQVFYVGLSIAEESVPEGFSKDAVEKETRLATKVLEIDPKKVDIKRFPVRRFPEYRQEILDIIINLRKEIKPDIVFIPATDDIHQDHEVVNRESIRAFRNCCSIYGYDFPWSDLYGMKMNVFYQLDERHIKKKVEAASCLKSQIVKKAYYLTEEYFRGLAIERGTRIGAKYAEAFEAIRDIKRIL